MPEATTVDQLFRSLREPFTAEPLFDLMSDMVFFIKNRAGEYLVVNETLVHRTGKRHKSELLGCTPVQVMGESLGRGYEIQDLAVVKSGRPLHDRLELHSYPAGDVGWCLTSKLPLLGDRGVPVGLVGVSRDLRLPDVSTEDFSRISNAVAFAEENLADVPTNGELAAIAGMSPYQLDRRMKRVFGVSTGQWLLKTRIDHAGRRLLESDLAVVDIGLAAGYTDQSAFTRQFRRATGMTPSRFRKLQAGVRQ